jgi:hypothetical protein
MKLSDFGLCKAVDTSQLPVLPENVENPDAVDLMRRLLCDVDSRLGTQVETPLVFTTSVRAGSARLLPWLDVLAMSHARSAESNRAHDAPWRACPRA